MMIRSWGHGCAWL